MSRKNIGDYSQEFREAAVRRMIVDGIPANRLSAELGVSKSALSKWRRTAEASGVPANGRSKASGMPANGRSKASGLSSADKFHMVMETYSMNESEIAEHCRRHGVYPEQLKEWRETCIQANEQQAALHQQLKSELRDEKRGKAAIEKELRRKEKALAEAAALLILQKKAAAIWGDPEEE